MLFSMLVAMAEFAPRPLPDADRIAIQKVSEIKMLDGKSARFIWPKQRDASLYCGFVNAKNAMGGYTGYKPFSVLLGKPASGFSILDYGAKGSSKTLIGVFSKACQDHGYSLNPSEPDAP